MIENNPKQTDIFENGYEALKETIFQHPELIGYPKNTPISMKLIKNLFPSIETAEKILLNLPSEHDMHKPPYLLLDIPEKGIQTMYKIAAYLYEEKSYQKAQAIFALLVFLSPHVADFWIGYGLTQMNAKLYEKSLKSFTNAIDLEKKSPKALILACTALAKLGQFDEALNKLDAAMSKTSQEEDFYTFYESTRESIIQEKNIKTRSL